MKLNFPVTPPEVIRKEGKLFLKDFVRKKLLELTPEEWVRQHFLRYLSEVLYYPRTLTGVEVSLQYGKLSKRCDILVWGADGNPYLMVECKAPQVKLSQKVIDQIALYNSGFQVPLLALTNGLEHYYFAKNDNKYSPCRALPAWNK